MLRDVNLILDAVLGDDDEDYKDVYSDESPDGFAQQLTSLFFRSVGSAIQDGQPWNAVLGDMPFSLRYEPRKDRYNLELHLSGEEPFSRGMSKGVTWSGVLTEKSFKGAALRLLTHALPEVQRRKAVSVLYQNIEAKLASSPAFKRFVDRLEGDTYQGHTIDYQGMTMDDVTFWSSVLNQYGH